MCGGQRKFCNSQLFSVSATQVFGTELRSSELSAIALTCWAILKAQISLFNDGHFSFLEILTPNFQNNLGHFSSSLPAACQLDKVAFPSQQPHLQPLLTTSTAVVEQVPTTSWQLQSWQFTQWLLLMATWWYLKSHPGGTSLGVPMKVFPEVYPRRREN